MKLRKNLDELECQYLGTDVMNQLIKVQILIRTKLFVDESTLPWLHVFFLFLVSKQIG